MFTEHIKKFPIVIFLMIYVLIGYSGIAHNSCCMNMDCIHTMQNSSTHSGCSECGNESGGMIQQQALTEDFLSQPQYVCSCDDSSLQQCETVEPVKPEYLTISSKQLCSGTKTGHKELNATQSGINNPIISQNNLSDLSIRFLHTVIQTI